MLLYENLGYSDKNSKILLTTILLLLSFFFATYNYSLTRGRMGGWRVPWTPQRGKNRFKAPLFQCKSFALKICPQPMRRADIVISAVVLASRGLIFTACADCKYPVQTKQKTSSSNSIF